MLIVAPRTSPTSAVSLRPGARAQPLDAELERKVTWESREDFAPVDVLCIELSHLRDDAPPGSIG
eukprot:13715103-Alexandrium_andersonii.AAC.1